MPFVRVRAPDAVQYQDVCTGITGAIGTSASVIGGTMIIPTSVRELIASGPLAHLTTINLDGSPQVTVVWVGIEDDEFVCAHMGVWKKVQNMQREPRVALSMLGHGKNAIGLQEYLVVYGQARITEGGAADLLQRLAYTYLSPTVVFHRSRSAASLATSRTSHQSALPAQGRGARRTSDDDALTEERSL